MTRALAAEKLVIVKDASGAVQIAFLDSSRPHIVSFLVPSSTKTHPLATLWDPLGTIGARSLQNHQKNTFGGVIFEPISDQKIRAFLIIILKASFGGAAPLWVQIGSQMTQN